MQNVETVNSLSNEEISDRAILRRMHGHVVQLQELYERLSPRLRRITPDLESMSLLAEQLDVADKIVHTE